METVQWETTTIPSEPTRRLVYVSNISSKTEQATIKDFFSFCGVIDSFEMKQLNDKQVALILFEQESSANTATLLSQAEIDELPIQVQYYFKEEQQSLLEKETVVEEQTAALKKGKSASRVMSELLASGYVLTDNVIAKGVEFDEKHGGYFNKMSSYFKSHLHQKFSSNGSTNNEDSAQIVNREATTTSNNSRMQSIKNSRAGVKIHGYASRFANKVTQVHEDAKRIAAAKDQSK